MDLDPLSAVEPLGDSFAGSLLGFSGEFQKTEKKRSEERGCSGRAGSMVAPRAAPPAGAFLPGRAAFHGRELLAELPLFTMDFG